MLKYFNYTVNAEDADFNNVVDCALELARATYENTKGADYADKNREVLTSIAKKSLEGTRYAAEFEAAGLAIFKKPQVTRSYAVRENFNAVNVILLKFTKLVMVKLLDSKLKAMIYSW